MTRTLSLAKYLPAVLCGLLLVAWVVSQFWLFGVVVRWPRGANGLGSSQVYCSYGKVSVEHSVYGVRWAKVLFRRLNPNPNVPASVRSIRNPLGTLRFHYHLESSIELLFPLPLLLTLSLPLALGCLNRFRFPLWSWFAWTALIAIELAYYLR